jgi:pentatricopeptide repeat protein
MAIGVLAVLSACVAYYVKGFDFAILLLWLSGLIACGSAFDFGRIARAFPFRRSDVLIACAFALASVPLYLWRSYDIPLSIGSDEIAQLSNERRWLNSGTIDVFGLSDYFGFTYLPYLIQAWCAQLLGGVDLYHLRLLHGVCGVLIVSLAYIFFRTVGLRRLMAVTATVALGANHSLFGLSRIISRQNSSLFAELLALTCLFAGLKTKSRRLTYLGGVLTGLCFYVYNSARITLLVWSIYLFLLFLNRRHRHLNGGVLVKHAATFIFGMALAVAPLAVAHIKQEYAINRNSSLDYQKHQCLLYPEGREFCMHWTDSKTVEEGIARNIVNGLGVFNNGVSDQSTIYNNPGHGFVDPLTGLLIWLGFFNVLIFRRLQNTAIFTLSGFLLIWLFFSLVTAEAPSFARLLVILPFAAYFVAYGVDAISTFFQARLKHFNISSRTVRSIISVMANLAILLCNVFIYSNVIQTGIMHGDDIGSTVRYIEARKHQPEHLFIVAASLDCPYFSYDNLMAWDQRIALFLSPMQQNKVWAPQDVLALKLVPPFTIFMNGDLYESKREHLFKMYPHLVVHNICDAGGLVAVEDAECLPESARVHLLYSSWNTYPERCEGLTWQGRNDQAIELCLAALNSRLAPVNGSYFRSDILFVLGRADVNKRNYKQGEKALLEAFQIRNSLLGEKTPDAARVANALGDVFARQGRWEDAEDWYRRSQEMIEATNKQNEFVSRWNPELAHAYRCIAHACMKQNRVEEAEKIFRKAKDVCRMSGMNGSEQAEIVVELDYCQKILTMSDTAILLLNDSISKETNPAQLADLYERLGFEYMKRGDFARAEQTYSKAIATALKKGALKPDDDLARIYAERGFVYNRLKKYSEAEQDFDSALKLSSTNFARQNHYQRERKYAHDQKILSQS